MVDVVAANREAATIGRARVEQIPAMAVALAGAFFDDPAFGWVLHDDPGRMPVLRRAFELFLRRVWIEHEQTYTTANVAGAAVWEPPGQWKTPIGLQLRLLPSIASAFKRHTPRVLRALTVMEGGHPAEPRHPPHYYLPFIGVDPRWQGRGLGAALLAPVLSRCDGERVPAFLEASTPRNRSLYERHGFEVLEEFRLGRGAPPQWRMWREPRAPAAAAVGREV
jgi:ribosomal protein S18 acetylase RimI-like enzyme